MDTYTTDHYRVNIRLGRVRAKQLREHAAWLQKAVGPAAFTMMNDMHSAADRLEILASMVQDLSGVTDAT